MDRKYLKEMQYDWYNDPRKLKINDRIVSGRCFHCARVMLNAENAICFCSKCDIAMSMCLDGPQNDFSDSNEPKKLLARRDARSPVSFEFEEESKKLEKEQNFKFANDKAIFKSTGSEEEDERIRKLYEL